MFALKQEEDEHMPNTMNEEHEHRVKLMKKSSSPYQPDTNAPENK